MSCAILSVWSKGGLSKNYGIAISNKDNELLKLICLQKSKFQSEIELLLNVFSNLNNVTDTNFYITFCPSKLFVDAAKCKKVSKIFYLPIYKTEIKDSVLESFKYNFGKVVDLFSVYKIPENV